MFRSDPLNLDPAAQICWAQVLIVTVGHRSDGSGCLGAQAAALATGGEHLRWWAAALAPDFTELDAPGLKSTRAWVRRVRRNTRNPPRVTAGLAEALDGECKGGGGSARHDSPACAWSGGSRGYGLSKLAKNDRGNRAGAHRGMLRVGDAVRRGRRRGSAVEAGGARGDVARRCLGASGPDGRTLQASVMLVDGSAWPERHRRQRNRRRSAPLLVGRWRRHCVVQGKAGRGGRKRGRLHGPIKGGCRGSRSAVEEGNPLPLRRGFRARTLRERDPEEGDGADQWAQVGRGTAACGRRA